MARLVNIDRFTIDMPPEMRAQLDRMAADKGWSVARCIRVIIIEHFARLEDAQHDTA